MRSDVKSELQMLREMGWHFLSLNLCYFCKRPLTSLPPDMTFGHKRHPRVSADLTIHHIDENRENNSPENRAPCHDSCHRSFHAKKRAVVNKTYREEVKRRYEETQQEKESGTQEGLLTQPEGGVE